MLEISDNLASAVRASVSLPQADRIAFVGRHLLAQAESKPLPVAEQSETSEPLSRAILQEELAALADVLTTAVNAASGRPGKALQHVAEHLLNGSGREAAAAAPEGAPAADGPGKGKKTARFAAAGGPERVGEPPKEMSKEYEGEKSADGLAEGYGKAIYANGDVHEGEWKNDRRDGKGTCKYASGEWYEGLWKADKKDGPGSMKYMSGDKYVGDWRFGKREGKGRATYASGDGYEGEWKADKKQGFGTFWSASGEVYEGQWMTGTYEGRGTYLYASSDVYEGEYHAGKRDGRGVYMYASGDVYEGEYKQGKMEGRGIYRLADGTAEAGRYFAGADVGEGARWSADRKTAYRLRGGRVEEEISLEEAARIAGALGIAVPPPSLGGDTDDEGEVGEPIVEPIVEQIEKVEKVLLEVGEQIEKVDQPVAVEAS